MKQDAAFTLLLRWRDERWRWVVTCDRCGADLSGDYAPSPVTFIKVPDLNMLQARGFEVYEAFVKRLRDAWDGASKTGRPLVIDKSWDVDTTQVLNLERVVIEHADKCTRRDSNPE